MSLINQLTQKLPVGKKNESTDYYFALNIGLSHVTAAVWGIVHHKLDIIGQSTLPYEGTEDLLERAHQALDEALGAFEIEPEKILFGVPDSWILEDNLKEPYLKLIRRMVKEYELEPLAYVTTTYAISHLLQKIEGVPPTAILLGLGEFIEISLLRGGKVVETRTTKRSEHLFEDVEKLLVQFTEVEVLPSKILLYNTKPQENTAKLRDELMSYPWMAKLPFLHFPKIEALEENFYILAIVGAGVTEIDSTVDLKHALSLVKPTPTKHLLTRTKILTTPKEEDEAHEELEKPLEDELGFVKGDIAQRKFIESDEKGVDEDEEELEEVLAEREEKDLEDDRLVVPQEFTPPVRVESRLANNIKDHTESLQIGKKLNLPFKFLSGVAGVGGVVKGPAILGIAVLVAFVAAYIFFVKASVTVFVEPKILEKETQVIADPNASEVNQETNIIPGKVVETSVEGTGKGSATGKKIIGDPAKGQVVLYNKTAASKTFSQGTILVGPSNLKFTLDSSVTVASQAAVEGGIAFGKATTSITASAIGPDSNLPAGTEFTVAQSPSTSYSAKVDQALSGGTSKDITVVTSDDQKKLQAQVLDELRQKAEEELKGKIEGDQKVIAESLTVVDGKYTFNKRVNDQAHEFTLDAKVKFKGTAYSDTDLRTIVSKLVSTQVPDGFESNLADTETRADISKVEKDGKLIFNAKFRAKLLPKLNAEEIKKKVKGRGVGSVAEALQEIENVIGSEITLSPQLPTTLVRMPILDKNITINVTPK